MTITQKIADPNVTFGDLTRLLLIEDTDMEMRATTVELALKSARDREIAGWCMDAKGYLPLTEMEFFEARKEFFQLPFEEREKYRVRPSKGDVAWAKDMYENPTDDVLMWSNLTRIMEVMTAAARKVLGMHRPDEARATAIEAWYDLWARAKGVVKFPYTVGPQAAMRDAIDLLRTILRRKELAEDHNAEVNWGRSRADIIERAVLAAEVQKKLDELTPPLRSAAKKYYIKGMSIAEIAATEGSTRDAVKKRLERVRKDVTGE